jgi:D-alanine-D-alanine ligase
MKNIAIICGTPSLEHSISLRAAYFVSKELTGSGLYNILFIAITKLGSWKYAYDIDTLIHDTGHLDTIHINDACDTIYQIGNGMINNSIVHCAFLTTHGKYGEDGHLQGYLTLNNIPYAGCGVTGSSNCFNKNICKYIAESNCIPTVPYVCIHKQTYDPTKLLDMVEHLGEDLVVKVNRGGSSIGVTKCSRKDLLQTVEDAFTIDTIILIESFIEIREISVGILEHNGVIECSDFGELLANPKEICDYKSKLDKTSANYADFAVTTNLSHNQSVLLRDYSCKLVECLELKGYARIDFFIHKDLIYLNEINTLPGFSKAAYFVIVFRSRYSYKELICKIIDDAIATS